MPGLIGGALAVITAALGSFGGWKTSDGAVKCSVPLGIIALICAEVAAIVGHVGGALSMTFCDGVECEGEICTVPSESEVQNSDGTTSTQSNNVLICKDDFDAFCSYGDMSFAALILAEITALVLLIAGCFACVACCCPNNYTKEGGGGGVVGQPVTIGSNQS